MIEEQNQNNTISYVCLLAIIFSFFGWIGENSARLVTQHVIDSRFHILPFIAPYGLVAFAAYFVIGDVNDIKLCGFKIFKEKNAKSIMQSNILSLIIIYVTVFFAELIVGFLWDKLFGVELWNYQKIPLHFTKYTGIISAIGYGSAAFLAIKYIFWPLLRLFKNKLNYNLVAAIDWSLGILIIFDEFLFILHVVMDHFAPMYWSLYI